MLQFPLVMETTSSFEHGLNKPNPNAREVVPEVPSVRQIESNGASVETKENVSQPSQGAPLSASTLPLPQPIKQDAPDTTNLTTAQSGNPAMAADDDVIEREWVNKAKQIVDETRDDPYEQEKEVSKLQADYIKKRYGKEIKAVNS